MMRWPAMSIRAAVLTAIVGGVVLPAIVVLALDSQLARSAQEPILQRSRSAVMGLSTAMLADPVWTLSAPALFDGLGRILKEPSVCAVELLDLPNGELPPRIGRNHCEVDVETKVLEAPVLHGSERIARLRVSFEDREAERQLAARRGVMTWTVTAQVLFGVAVIAGVLSARLLRPIGRLKRQAERLAASEEQPALEWPRRDELGELGLHLNSVQQQIRTLIVELEGKNQQLHRMAMYDHLTGLPNRTLLRELFVHEAALARRHGSPMALLFVDLDHFKSVNDSYGHAAGDELLVAVASRIRGALRTADVVCRMGGDEFLVLLPRADGEAQVEATAARLVDAVRQPLKLTCASEHVRPGGSIGVAMFPADGDDFDALVRAADVAMYCSKAEGRGRATFYRPEMDATLLERVAVERELAEAIEHRQLVLHYQPVVDARRGEVVGCEALVRWQHPQRGLVGPDAFIAVAESTGLIRPLGRWVLEEACRQMAAWREQGRPLRVAVNVSALQLREAGFADDVRQVMARHGVTAGALVLELTESTLFADSDAALRAVGALREAGVLLAVDDFGTGYSSLAALKLLRPARVKIDRSFVRDLHQGGGDAALVEAMFGMARALDIVVVAEGVETTTQRDWLLARGGVLQQGWLWSRALPADALAAWLDQRGATAAPPEPARGGVHNLPVA